VAVGIAGEEALMAQVFVALAVAVELIKDAGDLPRNLVREPGLADEEHRVKGWSVLSPRHGWREGP